MNRIIVPSAAIKQFNDKHGHVVAKLIKDATLKQPERAPYIDEDALYLQYNLNHSEQHIMKTTLSTAQVLATLLDFNVLGDRHEDAVYHGTVALVEYLEDLEENLPSQIELDPVAIRCEFSLYTINEAAEQWDIDTSGVDEVNRADAIIDYLRSNTTVVEVDETNLIIAEF